ncbi:MAG: hypothetical protein WD607_11235 [Candidatus Paceibacterota bacterium]
MKHFLTYSAIILFIYFIISACFKIYCEYKKRKELNKSLKSGIGNMAGYEAVKYQIIKKWEDKYWHLEILERSLITVGLPIIAIIISIIALLY